MSAQTISYNSYAKAFQCAKIESATDAGKAFSTARRELKSFLLVAKDYKSFIVHIIKDPAAQEKAMKKFGEWERKAAQQGKVADVNATYSPFDLITALYRFAEAFLEATKDKKVMDARLLKKAFKFETFKLFESGAKVEDLQESLKGLSEKTIHKVAYWMNTYQDLKASGKLQAKMEEMQKQIKA